MIRTLTIPTINFTLRSPYQRLPLPPKGRNAGGATLHIDDKGSIAVAGVVLTPYHSNTPGPDRHVAAVFDQGSYGDSQNVIATFTGAGMPVDGAGNPILFVLPRPAKQRTQLLIQNNTLGIVFYAFDRVADNTTCIGIVAGGSREFDARIPQGNLSLYANAGGAVVIEYMNNDIT